MTAAKTINPGSHVVDILGNVIGRDQPIMLMEKAVQLASLIAEETYNDDDVVFFDPFCKAGEVLLACAMLRCKAKAAKTSKLFSVGDVEAEIYGSNRYFALAPDERHHRLSRRTFLGNTNSHSDKYNHIIRDGNYLSEVDGRLDEEKFKKEFEEMISYIKQTSARKKIVAVGNPPYQESDGGHGGSAKLIFPFFVDALADSKSIDEFILVIPSRWFSGGKNLDEFRDKMLQSGTLKSLRYFERSEDVFPTVHVQGGVCFLHWKSDHSGKTQFIYRDSVYPMELSSFDIIPDDPLAAPIIQKILDCWKGEFVSQRAWSRKPFGLPTNFFQENDGVPSTKKGAVKCYTRRKTHKYISDTDIQKNKNKIDEWKVAVPKAYATGARRCTLPADQIFLIEKGAVCTETYNIISTFKVKSHAENMIEYLRTDFCRYLLGLRKLTQDIPKDRWAWVPYMDPAKQWTEDELFKIFKISKEQQAHIKKKVKEW